MFNDTDQHVLFLGLRYYNVHTVKSFWTSSATTEMAERCHLCCFSEHNGKLSSYVVIVQVRVVLKRTVVGDWRFDNLSGSHLQSQVNSVCHSMINV